MRLTVTGIVLSGVLLACSPHGPEQVQKSPDESSPTAAAAATNRTGFLSIDKPTQDKIGLQTAVLKATLLAPEVRGYGRVRDISLLGVAVAELAASRAATEASRAELERLK